MVPVGIAQLAPIVIGRTGYLMSDKIHFECVCNGIYKFLRCQVVTRLHEK